MTPFFIFLFASDFMTETLFSNLFYLVHKNGDKLYPVKMKNRETGKICFRVAPEATKRNWDWR